MANTQQAAAPTWRPLLASEDPQAGDIAMHPTLDSRQVHSADPEKGVLWLNIRPVPSGEKPTTAPIGPFPIDNYSFERRSN